MMSGMINLCDLKIRLDELRQFNATLETSSDKDVEKDIRLDKLRLEKDTIDSFDLDNNGKSTFTYENKVINFGNINEGLIPPSRIRKSGVNRLQ